MAPLTSVLIVDDEPAVRDLMARWVTSLGLSPETAANASEDLAFDRVPPEALRVRNADHGSEFPMRRASRA